MNRIILTLALLLAVTGLRAQNDDKAIGFIETTKPLQRRGCSKPGTSSARLSSPRGGREGLALSQSA